MAVKWLAENGITKRTETERHAYILERVAIIKDEYKRAFSRSRNIWFGKLTLDELLGRTGLNYLTDKVVDFYNSVHKNHNEKDVALEESIKLLEDKTPAVRESLLKELARNNYAETLKSDIMFLSSHLGAINDLVIGNFHDALKKYIEKEEYIRLK